MLEGHRVGVDPEVVPDAPLDVDGHVAESDGAVALVHQGLGHDAHRVGEVHHPGARRRPRRGLFGDLEHQGDGAQGLGQAPGAGRLLAETAVPAGQRLVGVAGRLPAHPELDDHEVGTVDGPVPVVGDDQVPVPPPPAQDAISQAADGLQAVGVGVEQNQLLDHHPVLVGAEAVHQLGGVGAATPHHGHFGSHSLNVTSCCGHQQGRPVNGPAPGGSVLAVDGGASKTDVWIVTEDGSILGTARGGGCNHQFFGLDGAMDALGSAIDAARDNAGLSPASRVTAGVYCLAGVDLPVDEERLGQAIGARGWTGKDLLFNDTMAVLRAGARSGWGVGVVCGSGLNCVGLGPDGSIERFPSLAELSGDFTPGGSWLGVRALGLALRARDGRGGPTVLTDLVPAHFGLADPESVLSAVYTGSLDYGRLFELARVCLDAAAAGDGAAAAAAGLLAGEVVAMAAAIISRLGVAGDEVEVVLGGGVFDSAYPAFTAQVEDGVRAVAPRARFRRLEAPPVLGAALLGLDAVGASGRAESRLRSAIPPTDPPAGG